MSPDVVEALRMIVFSLAALTGVLFVSTLAIASYLRDIRDELKRLAGDRESGKEKP